jgi:hypothetical protein
MCLSSYTQDFKHTKIWMAFKIIEIGYKEPSPPCPIVVQATLACIWNIKFHKHLQKLDLQTLNHIGDDGETS